MVKRVKAEDEQLSELFAPAEEVAEEKKSRVRGIYLSNSDRERADKAAGELGLTLNSLLKFAVRFFLKEYEAGRIKFEKEERIKIPE